MEFFYTCVLRFLRPALAREILSPVSVYLHRRPQEYPQLGFSVEGYFHRMDDRIYILWDKEKPPGVVFHEVAHAVLFHGLARGKAPGVPAWVDEGLAEYLAGSVLRTPQRVRFEEGYRVQSHFNLVRRAQDPFTLSDVLHFEQNDFLSSNRRELRYAQSYCLVHYLLHGEGFRLRDGFFAFLREVAAGGASPAKLLDCLGYGADPFHETWMRYVGRL